MWLIQGLFFQNQEWLDVERVPIDGNIVVIKSDLIQTMFGGIIYPDTKRAIHTLTGEIFDYFGLSVLSDVFVSEGQEVRFVKKYTRRNDLIEYSFKSTKD